MRRCLLAAHQVCEYPAKEVNPKQDKVNGYGNYVRLQTSLSIASDDMDNATNGNIENLKKEAQKLIRSKAKELDRICEVLNS